LFGGGDTNLYGYVLNDPINFIDPAGLWAFGLIGGAAVEGGIVAGAGANGSLGAGVFGGGPAGVSTSAFASGGGFAGASGGGILGAFAGLGGGFFLSNATNAAQLSGLARTYSLNIGVGPFKFSGQFSVSGNTWMGSATFGPGAGIDASIYSTKTSCTK
jgi:hypothetical protein